MYLQKARHLLRLLGRDRDAHALRLEDVDEYIRAREQEGAHGGTVYKEIVTLRQALKWAVRRKHFVGDPATIIPPLKNEYEPRRRHLGIEEFGKLLYELLQHRRCWTIVTVYTGARRSDVERLVGEDHVDLANGWVRLPGTKTKLSDRTVPIAAGLRAYLESVPAAQRSGRVVAPWSSVNHDLAAACARACIGKISPNDLRRSYASWLKQGGEDSMVVARLLGHTSTQMVERVYGHLSQDNYRNAASKLPALPAEAGSASVVTPSAREASQARRASGDRRARSQSATQRSPAFGRTRGFFCSEPGRNRTYNPRIKSPLLYQLSYEPERRALIDHSEGEGKPEDAWGTSVGDERRPRPAPRLWTAARVGSASRRNR